MHPERQEYVIQEQLVRLPGIPNRWQHRPSEMGNRSVVESHRVMIQVADSRRVRIVRDRIKRIPWELEK